MDNRGRQQSPGSCEKTMTKADAVTYYTQVVVIIVVVIASLINLSIEQEPSTLWIMLLTSCVGYVLPNPRLLTESKEISMTESLMVTEGSTLVTTSAGTTKT